MSMNTKLGIATALITVTLGVGSSATLAATRDNISDDIVDSLQPAFETTLGVRFGCFVQTTDGRTQVLVTTRASLRKATRSSAASATSAMSKFGSSTPPTPTTRSLA
ncbi:hypothetical protein Q5424_00950 [Conexibacter sp. JD483]|uniref:hypothetical protein n=1 Tax=unclassified Conexibacter TaxID=2627773 RepID=UPI0027287EB5|nr:MULTISPECIES: hypothetical protein [unclassified Conexibacter]MDO8185795.1 hypothetical protein [Conexibacter sp. CPCC 205706]MDO8198539.1 hypothetical protein [Conexibacter sp. CPCC 205762]MDR9367625.1 hypothetical protein [Conexibacter sp. JD483]